MRVRKTTLSKNRGQAMVEFLLTLIFLFTLIFGIVQLIVLVYTYVELAQAAKAGVRYAIVHGSNSGLASGPGNTTGVENAIRNYSNHPSMVISVTYLDGSSAPPSRVRVQLSYPFSLLALGWTLPTIRASAQGRIAF